MFIGVHLWFQMSFLDLMQFAWSALRGHRLRSILSTLGVAIGITSVVLLTALGEGARIYVTSQLAALGSDLLIILPGKVETSGVIPVIGGVPHDLTLDDAMALQRRIPVIRKLAPATMGQTTVSHGSLSRNVMIIGATPEFLDLQRLILGRGSSLPSGEMTRGSNVAVIGTAIQQQLYGGGNPLGKVLRIGDFRFRVIGVLAPKGEHMGFNFDEIIMIPVATSMKVFNLTTLFRIFVQANSFQDLNQVKKQITEVIEERHKEEDITLLTQDSVLASFNQIFNALTLALAGIAAISLTVAGIGIMNVMLVSVSERTSEIGLLKAVGVTRGQIVLVFLAEALLLSLVGGLTGLAAAVLSVRLVTGIFPSFPAEIPPWSILLAVGVSMFVGVLFGVWPARRASRLDPILALTRR